VATSSAIEASSLDELVLQRFSVATPALRAGNEHRNPRRWSDAQLRVLATLVHP